MSRSMLEDVRCLEEKEQITDDQKHNLYVQIFEEDDEVKCKVASNSPELRLRCIFIKKAEKTLHQHECFQAHILYIWNTL